MNLELAAAPSGAGELGDHTVAREYLACWRGSTMEFRALSDAAALVEASEYRKGAQVYQDGRFVGVAP